MEKLYQNPQWLYQKYHNEKLSLYEMGSLCSVAHTTVDKYMKRFYIQKRATGEAILNHSRDALYRKKDWLLDKYINCKLSIYAIEKLCDGTHGSILRWLNIFNIPVRTIGECNHMNRGHDIVLSNKAIELINGEMLGDGNISLKCGISANISYGSKYYEYLDWLSRQLQKFQIEQVGSISKGLGGFDTIIYSYRSCSYPALLDIQKKWYIPYRMGIHGNDKSRKRFKIVPRDIELTPLVCMHWYLGDGNLKHANRGNCKDMCRFATCGFTKDDVLFLVDKLNKMGFKCTRHNSDNTINFSTTSTKAFLDYMGPCPEGIKDIYGYKWDYRQC